MPKREPKPPPIEEEQLDPTLAPAGERLRIAREAKGLSLEVKIVIAKPGAKLRPLWRE